MGLARTDRSMSAILGARPAPHPLWEIGFAGEVNLKAVSVPISTAIRCVEKVKAKRLYIWSRALVESDGELSRELRLTRGTFWGAMDVCGQHDVHAHCATMLV